MRVFYLQNRGRGSGPHEARQPPRAVSRVTATTLVSVFAHKFRNQDPPRARRTRTTIAPQSLALLNSELSMEAARHLAGRALIAQSEQQDSTRASQVTSLYRYTLGRRPRDHELQLAVEFIDRQIAILKASGRQRADIELPQPLPAGTDPHVGAAFTALSLSLVNLNEFVYVD